MTKDFRQRPTAAEALEHWYQVKSKLNSKIARLRLGKPDASVGDTVVNTLADGIVNLTWLFDEVGQAHLYLITNYRNGFGRTLDRGRRHDEYDSISHGEGQREMGITQEPLRLRSTDWRDEVRLRVEDLRPDSRR